MPPELDEPEDGEDVVFVGEGCSGDFVTEASGTLCVRWFGRAGTEERPEVGAEEDLEEEDGFASVVGVGEDDGTALVVVVVWGMLSVAGASSVMDGGTSDAGIGMNTGEPSGVSEACSALVVGELVAIDDPVLISRGGKGFPSRSPEGVGLSLAGVESSDVITG